MFFKDFYINLFKKEEEEKFQRSQRKARIAHSPAHSPKYPQKPEAGQTKPNQEIYHGVPSEGLELKGLSQHLLLSQLP